MFHNLELAHQYLGVNVVGERYDVLSRTIDNGLQRLHLHDRYTFREMDVWVETVNITDGCLMRLHLRIRGIISIRFMVRFFFPSLNSSFR